MIIPATPKTPLIRFDAKNSKLEIVGRSIPEDAEELYEPVLQLLERVQKEPKAALKVVLQLEYFNTHSSRMIVEILRTLETMFKSGYLIKVFWVCEDQDEETIDYADDLRQMVELPIDTTVLSEEKYDDFLVRARLVTI